MRRGVARGRHSATYCLSDPGEVTKPPGLILFLCKMRVITMPHLTGIPTLPAPSQSARCTHAAYYTNLIVVSLSLKVFKGCLVSLGKDRFNLADACSNLFQGFPRILCSFWPLLSATGPLHILSVFMECCSSHLSHPTGHASASLTLHVLSEASSYL